MKEGQNKNETVTTPPPVNSTETLQTTEKIEAPQFSVEEYKEIVKGLIPALEEIKEINKTIGGLSQEELEEKIEKNPSLKSKILRILGNITAFAVVLGGVGGIIALTVGGATDSEALNNVMASVGKIMEAKTEIGSIAGTFGISIGLLAVPTALLTLSEWLHKKADWLNKKIGV